MVVRKTNLNEIKVVKAGVEGLTPAKLKPDLSEEGGVEKQKKIPKVLVGDREVPHIKKKGAPAGLVSRPHGSHDTPPKVRKAQSNGVGSVNKEAWGWPRKPATRLSKGVREPEPARCPHGGVVGREAIKKEKSGKVTQGAGRTPWVGHPTHPQERNDPPEEGVVGSAP